MMICFVLMRRHLSNGLGFCDVFIVLQSLVISSSCDNCHGHNTEMLITREGNYTRDTYEQRIR